MSDPNDASSPLDRLIFALDVETSSEALEWADRLHGHLRWLKVGPKLFTAAGPTLITTLRAKGFRIFLDLKFHDIPEVVAGAVREATRLEVSILTIHASGGPRMMRAAAQAAREEAAKLGTPPPLVLGVTMLTSLDAGEVARIGYAFSPEEMVDRLAGLALEADLGGIVCSPHEIARVRAATHGKLVVLTPGIRPASLSDDGRPLELADDDQQRVATPAEAIRAGADFLVVGRPIRKAPDPLDALARILGEMLVA